MINQGKSLFIHIIVNKHITAHENRSYLGWRVAAMEE
jgi:hypothetical protein